MLKTTRQLEMKKKLSPIRLFC